MQLDTEATICAIATGHINGCRGAVRITGWNILAVLAKAQASLAPLRDLKRPTRVSIEWNLQSTFGTIPVDVWYWPTQRSYTGMPSAELHTLGNQLLLKRIATQLCQAGARLAFPGEFTLRAFLSGRMDLTQCEAVLGVIEAESQEQLDIALKQLAGGMSKPLASLRQSLIDLLADLEAGLDFVDEDIEFISREQIMERLESSILTIQHLERQLVQRHVDQRPPQVALLGLPNAGKSSIANALTQRNAAIVSPLAGTTRDFLRMPCQLEHGMIELVDTAGIESDSEADTELSRIERRAQRYTQEQRDEAELILYCIDSCLDEDIRKQELGHAITDMSNAWVIWTKTDLSNPNSLRDLSQSNEHTNTLARFFFTSSRDPSSLDRLRIELDEWFVLRSHEFASVAPMTAIRCKESLRTALEALHTALAAADQKTGDEIVAGEIRLALESLATVAGEVYTDDVLDSLFRRFCIGK